MRGAAHRYRRQIRRRQRLAVELAVRRQRQRLEHHQSRRHHVVRQRRRQLRTHRRHIDRGLRRGHQIAHQPLVAGLVLARDHRRLRHRCLPHQHGLDLAGLDAEAAQLHLLIGTPQKVQHAICPPARQIAGAVHARCQPPRTDRPRTAPPSARPARDSRAPGRTPRCTARPQRQQEPDAARRPERRPACSQIGRPIGNDRQRIIAAIGRERNADRSLFRSGRRRLVSGDRATVSDVADCEAEQDFAAGEQLFDAGQARIVIRHQRVEQRRA